MIKKVLHIVFVLLLVLAIPFSPIAKPVAAKAVVKHDKTHQKSDGSSSKTFLQPQVIHAHVTYAHVLPCILDHHRHEIIFPQEEATSSASVTLLDKGTSKFFKTLFRHFIATQAP
jgi:hypothetical protein